MKQILIILSLLDLPLINVFNQVTGYVFENDEHAIKVPLAGVSVFWKGTTTSVSTGSDGKFILENSLKSNMLIFSYIGYANDTILLNTGTTLPVEVILKPEVKNIEEVVKTARAKGENISRINPVYTTTITSAGLKKSACCNIGESFQNNSSVDVTYSDAITGAKQIQLLGLAGVYSQLLTENIPNMRGLATNYGLNYIPGSWLESIQISKGVSSVRNGYEAFTGQINAEFKKPQTSERFYINGFGDDELRFEINSDYSAKVNNKWATMLFVHANKMNNKFDKNNDGFLDQPLVSQYNVYNRWNYSGNNFEFQTGIKYLNEERNAGQVNFDNSLPRTTLNGFGIGIKTEREELYTKTAYNSPGRTNTSLALILSASNHNQKSFYGLKTYNADQRSLYSNLIFITYIGTTDHILASGLTMISDWYIENLNNLNLNHDEFVPGIYTEYTFKPSDSFTAIAGIRADKSSKFGKFITPRVLLKFNPIEDITLRASAGKGFRSPNAIAENAYLLASSKQIVFLDKIKLEEAWNYGLSCAWQPSNNSKRFTLSADYFRTDFQNQLIADIEQNATQINFYNQQGKSYSNSFQIESSIEPVKNLSVSAAYRINDVKITINNNLRQKPLTNKHKALLILDYATPKNNWQFNYTIQYNGGGRLPDTYLSVNTFETQRKFPAFYLMHAQVTYKFKNTELYLGGENLTNYKQNNPIIAANEPFSNIFDASQVWGPISGAMFYGGFRYKFGNS